MSPPNQRSLHLATKKIKGTKSQQKNGVTVSKNNERNTEKKPSRTSFPSIFVAREREKMVSGDREKKQKTWAVTRDQDLCLGESGASLEIQITRSGPGLMGHPKALRNCLLTYKAAFVCSGGLPAFHNACGLFMVQGTWNNACNFCSRFLRFCEN